MYEKSTLPHKTPAQHTEVAPTEAVVTQVLCSTPLVSRMLCSSVSHRLSASFPQLVSEVDA